LRASIFFDIRDIRIVSYRLGSTNWTRRVDSTTTEQQNGLPELLRSQQRHLVRTSKPREPIEQLLDAGRRRGVQSDGAHEHLKANQEPVHSLEIYLGTHDDRPMAVKPSQIQQPRQQPRFPLQ
jgi:hypothetical protein